jgi:hypothetical protein
LSTVRTEADELQRQMAEIRSQLLQEMRGVVHVAQNATDWRSYVRGRPWIALSVAFAAGFLLVPGRPRAATVVIQPSGDLPSSEMAVRAAQRKRWPWIRWLLLAVGPVALRVGQSYALDVIQNLVANQHAEPSAETASESEGPRRAIRPKG